MGNCCVSVIVPAYNCEHYLSDCLQSLKKQTLKDIEIIVINDGSTDRTLEIANEFAKNDSRFLVITQPNGGSASARRSGMLRASGEYIGFVDSDDWTESDMFEKMYQTAKKNAVDIVFCNCYRNFENSQKQCAKYLRNGYYDRKQIKEEILPMSLAGLDNKGRNHVIRWANYLRLYKRELIERHHIYNDPRFRRCQDLQLTFEATLYAQSYYYMGDDYLYHNRVVPGSQSRGYTQNQWQKIRILIEKLYEDVFGFDEMDLRPQMDLCAFFFAVSSVENEFKECEGMNKEDHLKKICEIYSDELCDRFLPSIPVNQLSKVNQMYYFGIKNKDVSLLSKANIQQQKAMKKALMISKVLSVSLIRKMYLKVRR